MYIYKKINIYYVFDIFFVKKKEIKKFKEMNGC